MRKVTKNIMKLINKVGDSLSFLKNGTKNSLVMGAVDKVGLITGLVTTPLMWPIYSVLNFTSFLGVKL